MIDNIILINSIILKLRLIHILLILLIVLYFNINNYGRIIFSLLLK